MSARPKTSDKPRKPGTEIPSYFPPGALLPRLKNVELTLAIGSYAIAYHMKERAPSRKESLTDSVRACDFGRDAVLALPHPSPRNLLWLKKNPWFEAERVPKLRRRVAKLLS